MQIGSSKLLFHIHSSENFKDHLAIIIDSWMIVQKIFYIQMSPNPYTRFFIHGSMLSRYSLLLNGEYQFIISWFLQWTPAVDLAEIFAVSRHSQSGQLFSFASDKSYTKAVIYWVLCALVLISKPADFFFFFSWHS